ncbi:N-acetyltransferase [Streptomyces sp. WMMC500]|uniref:GNAT family N-acetyltransferase n=1 Tax=Streptomyces sp. WMMC500 TaxID=3015154 RepID=UPI00248D1ACD|nr:N-acetyltransferase [Streptomyces sp. WMMC500]WBB61983.1 N-acetyltransferase [Streptomyces sp. WMMC500]
MADHLIPALVEVERRAHQASSHYDDEPWRAENFTRALPGKQELSLVAVARGSPVGFLIASRQQHGAHIHRLATDPGHWGTGTASQLLDRFLTEVPGTVTVVCDPHNKPALSLYERAGFRVTGSTPAGKAALARPDPARAGRTSAER